MTDAVLQEIHEIKDAIAKEHKNDVRAALAAARARSIRSAVFCVRNWSKIRLSPEDQAEFHQDWMGKFHDDKRCKRNLVSLEDFNLIYSVFQKRLLGRYFDLLAVWDYGTLSSFY